MTLYKWLGENGQPVHGGSGAWSLPNSKPGKWRTVKGELVPCKNGIHLCREQDLIYWCAPTLYEAEYTGRLIQAEDKLVVRRARLLRRVETWTERTARLFACDCAERALDQEAVVNPQSRAAIATARAFANGQATSEELAAAWNAAWAAAWDAGRAAARAAAWAAGRDAAWNAAWDAAWAAARAAAWDAAWAAARDAARDAERQWQIARLMAYLRGEIT